MIIYIAGGITGNLKPAYKTMSRKNISFMEALRYEGFLAGGETRHWLHDVLSSQGKEKGDDSIFSRTELDVRNINHSVQERESDSVRIFLAGVAPWRNEGVYDTVIKEYHPYILESFYYIDDDTERLIPYFGDFMLDSGAFTFMQNSKSHVEWDGYLERYADFINRNNIDKFFELDIDSVVGYEKVLDYRRKLERLTGKPCIPVWHYNRGKDEFIRMCEEYSYVAIGGLVGGSTEYSRRYWKFFPWFIQTAHKNNSKIHALGFTSADGIVKYHFDSVDSTAWTSGNRFGFVWKFDGKGMKKIACPQGKRLKDSRKIALINYTEWLKFQKYAEVHL